MVTNNLLVLNRVNATKRKLSERKSQCFLVEREISELQQQLLNVHSELEDTTVEEEVSYDYYVIVFLKL